MGLPGTPEEGSRNSEAGWPGSAGGSSSRDESPQWPPSSAPVTVPLWSRNFCRMACRQGWGQQGQGVSGVSRPPHRYPPHPRSISQGPVWGQQGHEPCPWSRGQPLADLREGRVDQGGWAAAAPLSRDSAWVDLQVGGRWWSGHTTPPPLHHQALTHLASLALTTCWHSAGSGCCSRVQVGPEHTAAQAGLELPQS